MIGSYRKYFRSSMHDVLWQTSWVNFQMDLASIPEYNTKKPADEVDNKQFKGHPIQQILDEF